MTLTSPTSRKELKQHMSKTQLALHTFVAVGCVCILPFMMIYWVIKKEPND